MKWNRWIMLLGLITSMSYAQTLSSSHRVEKPLLHIQPLLDRPVDIGVYIDDIGSIDAKQHKVSITGILTMQLHPFTGMGSIGKSHYYDEEAWQAWLSLGGPNLYFLHQKGERVNLLSALSKMPDGGVRYQERFAISLENFINVRDFPFDHHTLMLKVMPFGMERHHTEFKEHKAWEGISLQVKLNEWRVSGVHTSAVTSIGESPYTRSAYRLVVDYSRQHNFYVIKIFLPMLMLVILSMLSLLMRHDPTANRSSISVACILSLIALQWVVYQDIPKVSYATFTDILFSIAYVTSFVVVAAMCVFNEILTQKAARRWRKVTYWMIPTTFVMALALAVFTFFG